MSDMQRFDFKMRFNWLAYNPTQLFRSQHTNFLIAEILVSEDLPQMELMVTVFARPKKDEEIYREQLDHLFYEQ